MDRVIQSLTIPTVPGACLSANSRAHHMAKYRERQRIYGIVRAEAIQQRWQPIIDETDLPVEVEIEIVWAANKRGKLPDYDNQQAYAKVFLDAIRPCGCKKCVAARLCLTQHEGQFHCRDFWWWYGIITDDSPRYVKAVRVLVLKGEQGPQTTIRLLRTEEKNERAE